MLHKFFVTLTTLLIALTVASCSAKKKSSSASFKLYLGAQVVSDYSFTIFRATPTGELKNEDGTLRTPFETTLGDKLDGIVEVPNGKWIFQIVAFESADVATAIAHCGEYGPVGLDGKDITVEIVISETNCSLSQNQVLVTQIRDRFSNTQGQLNTPPIANPIVAPDIDEDTTTNIILSYNDLEGDSASTCSGTGVTGVSVISCTCTAGICTLSAVGLNNYEGSASIDYNVSTGNQVSNNASISFTINPVDDAPVGNLSLAPSISEDGSTFINLTYTDVDGDEATICTISNLTNASITTGCSCTLGSCGVEITPNANFYGDVTFDYTVTAGTFTSAPQTVTLPVTPEDDYPTVSTPAFMSEGNNRPFMINLPFVDVDGDPPSACSISVTPPVNSNCTCSASTCDAMITPEYTDRGNYSFSFTVTTNGATSDPGNGNFDINFNCPMGFIPVDTGNPATDFCVMKYEARDSGGDAVSTEAGTPWVGASMSIAYSSCQNIIDGDFPIGGQFGLITNSEWIKVAQSIELEASNWSGGVVGSGSINRGWSSAGAIAPRSTSDCLFDDGNTVCDVIGSYPEYKRTHLLNGEEIWDFAGNVREWVDWGVPYVDFVLTPGPIDVDEGAGYLGLDVDPLSPFVKGSLTNADIGNSTPYDSNFGFGKVIGGNFGMTTRGGDYNDGAYAGIYNLDLSSDGNGASNTGFRCVYRKAP